MANSTIRNIVNTLDNQIQIFGRSGVSALFPREIEYYVVALELTTFEGDTIDYFLFPITPSSITKSENERTSVYSTINGTTIINTDSFVPKDLTITGDFGRQFKILIGNRSLDTVSFKAIRFSSQSGVNSADEVNSKTNILPSEFNKDVKTGYGCIKILQSIIDRAKGHDNGKPFRLYFYNPALGESYLVTPTKTPLNLVQNEAKNMIWSYTLNLTIIAPLDRIDFSNSKKKDLNQIFTPTNIQSSVNNVANSLIKFTK